MWHLTENMDGKTIDANKIEFQEVESKFEISGYKIQIPLNFKG